MRAKNDRILADLSLRVGVLRMKLLMKKVVWKLTLSLSNKTQKLH